ncbi:uncharacterized protein LOC129568827 [Sitodiplosis mosellana]|uniref:uncharacterized protein LOC129568827 n=1 Tax=Sitodiplosis mosellana TaxID=263140 RepID=UPI0024443969|nr:uncharacterized protein LOC129568827 [Sitodiplosis mosellana]
MKFASICFVVILCATVASAESEPTNQISFRDFVRNDYQSLIKKFKEHGIDVNCIAKFAGHYLGNSLIRGRLTEVNTKLSLMMGQWEKCLKSKNKYQCMLSVAEMGANTVSEFFREMAKEEYEKLLKLMGEDILNECIESVDALDALKELKLEGYCVMANISQSFKNTEVAPIWKRYVDQLNSSGDSDRGCAAKFSLIGVTKCIFTESPEEEEIRRDLFKHLKNFSEEGIFKIAEEIGNKCLH